MSPRNAFEVVLSSLRDTQAELAPLSTVGNDFQKALESELMDAAKKKLGRKAPQSFDLIKIQKALGPEAEEITTKHRAAFFAVVDPLQDKVALLRKQLDELAIQAEVHPLEGNWMLLTTVWDVTYNSQGFSAGSYAKNHAEMSADIARLCDVPVEVRRVMHPSSLGGSPLGTWEVHVAVESEVDLEILKRRPGPSLREQVRLCWARGVNPRVFNPFLPYDFEQKNGLDYFGREVSK